MTDITESWTDEFKALMKQAEATGNTELIEYLRASSRVRLPSIEELEALFCCDLLQQ
jgi:hypothetical protein